VDPELLGQAVERGARNALAELQGGVEQMKKAVARVVGEERAEDLAEDILVTLSFGRGKWAVQGIVGYTARRIAQEVGKSLE